MACLTVLACCSTSWHDVTRYGHPTPTQVRITPVKGKAILISGHDMHDLEDLLKQTEGTVSSQACSPWLVFERSSIAMLVPEVLATALHMHSALVRVQDGSLLNP